MWRHILQKDYAFDEKLQAPTQVRKFGRCDGSAEGYERTTFYFECAVLYRGTGGVSLDYFLGSNNT